ncbi:hypothetical protein FBU59_003239 [Linderina macrospora]|uniref:Uncharacterized protein n=1 Tax=Linderina macrospora TaxID=4868 RepID=A0ACC1J972_9FUNG|nr:hypothetical protein FBU59_003239 [Linderina macrospora]
MGLQPIKRWNLQTSQEEWPKSIEGSQVHSGFLDGYTAAREDMLDAVLRLAKAYPDYSIALVGHSLGGARAALALLDLATTEPQLVPRLSMYSYGAPRVGNSAFAKAIGDLDVPVYRVVYEDDVVPHLPPSSFGFVHHNIEDWIHEGEHQFCRSTEQSDTCSGGGGGLAVDVSAHYAYPGLKYE